jgi:hypothetical protein
MSVEIERITAQRALYELLKREVLTPVVSDESQYEIPCGCVVQSSDDNEAGLPYLDLYVFRGRFGECDADSVHSALVAYARLEDATGADIASLAQEARSRLESYLGLEPGALRSNYDNERK